MGSEGYGPSVSGSIMLSHSHRITSSYFARFRLISGHGGHRWSILVSQHGGQHIDLGFHWVVPVAC